jgi:hypothetical protein
MVDGLGKQAPGGERVGLFEPGATLRDVRLPFLLGIDVDRRRLARVPARDAPLAVPNPLYDEPDEEAERHQDHAPQKDAGIGGGRHEAGQPGEEAADRGEQMAEPPEEMRQAFEPGGRCGGRSRRRERELDSRVGAKRVVRRGEAVGRGRGAMHIPPGQTRAPALPTCLAYPMGDATQPINILLNQVVLDRPWTADQAGERT